MLRAGECSEFANPKKYETYLPSAKLQLDANVQNLYNIPKILNHQKSTEPMN